MNPRPLGYEQRRHFSTQNGPAWHQASTSVSYQGFVVTETNGRWGKAIEVPGSAALNAGGNAGVGSVSCATASSCSADGQYQDGSARFQAFVVSKTLLWRRSEGGCWPPS